MVLEELERAEAAEAATERAQAIKALRKNEKALAKMRVEFAATERAAREAFELGRDSKRSKKTKTRKGKKEMKTPKEHNTDGRVTCDEAVRQIAEQHGHDKTTPTLPATEAGARAAARELMKAFPSSLAPMPTPSVPPNADAEKKS